MLANFKILRITRRYVSSSLASTFNRVINKREGLSRTGLFGIEELSSPDGFRVLRDNALRDAKTLVKDICTGKREDILPLFDELSNTLCKVADLAEFVRVGHTQPRFRSAAEQASVAISTLVENLNTNQELYNALKRATAKDELDQRVIDLLLFDFEQSGIHLNNTKRKEVLDLNENMLKFGLLFSANAAKSRLINKNQVADKHRHLFKFDSTDTAPIDGPFENHSDDKVRELGYKLFFSYDETQDYMLHQLLTSRLKLAQLCGYNSFAERAMKGSIAGSPEFVDKFLRILNDKLKNLADEDYKQILNMKQGSSVLNAWDVPYYSNMYKKNFHVDSVVKCMPYFSIGSCMDGLNLIFNKLYGVSMQVDTCSSGELWHNEIIKLSIVDDNTQEIIGYIYCDLFERPLKQNQDCHHTVRTGCLLRDGSYQKPIVVFVLNLSYSGDESAALLSPKMVDNLFHEMGHAMHSMLARTRYQHISGTRCSTDLAEVPSILMEFFASDPRIISQFARHHSTGEQIPESLLPCWLESKRNFAASETQLQLFYAALDQAYHSDALLEQNVTTTEMLQQVQAKYYPQIPYVHGTAWQLRFGHLVGYGARYYSYLISRAVATAIWEKLFEPDPLSRSAGTKFKDGLLVHGGGKDAQSIIKDVLERSVDPEFAAEKVCSSLS